jgi:hypothetical protein
MSQPKQKFSSQAEAKLLKAVRKLAKEEGRPLQSLIDEALRDLIDKKRGEKPRNDVMKAYQESLKQYDSVYKCLV